MADKYANPASRKPADENADEDIVGAGENDSDLEDDDVDDDDVNDDEDLDEAE